MIEIETIGLEGLEEGSLDIARIRQEITDAANRALDFLEAHGVQVDRNLKVRHILDECALIPNVPARANISQPIEEAIFDHLAMRKRLMQEQFGIVLSQEALEELGNLMRTEYEAIQERLKTHFAEEFDDETDIFVYGEELPDADYLAATFAHELWHLIETRAGILKPSEMIHEGTATYVQERFSGDDPEDIYIDPEENNPPHWYLYHRGAQIVAEELGDNSFEKILDPEFRKKIKERFDREVIPQYIKASMQNEQIGGLERASLTGNAHFAAFVSDPTHDNLIRAYRSSGLNKMAEDVDQQDTSKYIAYLERVLQSVETATQA